MCVGQVKLIREKFEAALGKEGARMVDINTIDGFQVWPSALRYNLQSACCAHMSCQGTAAQEELSPAATLLHSDWDS